MDDNFSKITASHSEIAIQDDSNPTKDAEKSQNTTLDDVYRSVGEFGPFQRRVVFILSLVSFSTAFNNLGYVFWAARPDFYYCMPPVDDQLRLMALMNQSNASVDANDPHMWSNLTTPGQSSDKSSCTAYDVSNVNNLTLLENDVMRATLNVTSCTRWYYDDSQYESTIVTLWDLVCSKSWLVSFTQSAYMAGRIFGTQIYGHALDRFGRRKILLVATSLQVVFAVSCALVNNIYGFLVLRFLLGIQTTGELQATFILASEIVGPSYRVLAATAVQLVWAVAYMALAGIAYLLRDRFTLHICISAPLVAIPILFFWFIPESPRWLLLKGRKMEALKILKKVAASNGTEVSASDLSFSETKENQPTPTSSVSFLDLFKTTKIRRITLLIVYLWFVNSFVFYGLSLSATSIGGNDYINFFISGAVEIPAHLACLFTLERFGRIWPLSVSMSFAGLVLLAVMFIPADLQALTTVMVMLGKMSITYSYALVYLYTPEVYPTVIRGIGLGAGAMMSRIGGVVAPLIADAGSSFENLPSLLFGLFALIAGLLSLGLPETRRQPLMQTIQDAELLLEDSALTSCCKKVRKKVTKKNIEENTVEPPATKF